MCRLTVLAATTRDTLEIAIDRDLSFLEQTSRRIYRCSIERRSREKESRMAPAYAPSRAHSRECARVCPSPAD